MTSLPAIVLTLLQELNSSELREQLRNLVFEELDSNTGPGRLSHTQKQDVIEAFSRLEENDVIALGHQDSVCPICFTSLLALLSEEETAIAMDSPAHPTEELGVIRLSEPWQCGHIFCKRDISRWVLDGHDSCPTCRRPLVKTTDSGSQTDATQADTGGDAHDDPNGVLNILEAILRNGGVDGRFIPDTVLPRRSPHLNYLSNEHSAMYS
ncbi:hypothetical protein E1B28_004394 [Marasmius oreades]|uniref:RING-type domain-containing protein n=1 Tax=Marasmius oreades TaxID=181124 RepID=A0A9P7UYH2_9AGAR|nr:uncharacterized protein E1B28_004394 [Marasmius oreades]KAG7096999.1 hypothetical protein E1B28_004394 [Marasmius oreades]